ncbi:Uncharacterised protein [Mycobacteroides abscessus subsp. massiliense]|nr:Uncharacterised protein [Mycobacteroides abscessus subsp. massiliense]
MAMVDTMDVPFTRLITSLAALGMTDRMAWGSTIRKNWRRRGMPSAAAASNWPSSTDRMPPRMISAK